MQSENMIYLCSILLGMLCNTVSSEGMKGLCQGVREHVCCAGYLWNITTKTCQECSPGLYGIRCSLQCQYPSYGKACQETCLCESTFCHHITGCIRTTSQPIPVSLAIETTAHIETISYEKQTVNSISSTTQSPSKLDNTKILLLGIIAVIGFFAVIFSIFCMFYIFNKMCQRKRMHFENIPRSYGRIQKEQSAVNMELNTDGLEIAGENLELSAEVSEVNDHYERVEDNVDGFVYYGNVNVRSSASDAYLYPVAHI
ncbi:uncharacterized protein LOC130052935 [Ostrea edulis]|uniref:uncharacterized protein LOC130052935 n=1 Tax=Ostrea edulis TaxID=37623 RepID=UPI0024AEC036|nr:uncharacterized protein LOC130052935 [Ostrea edulis]